MSHLLCCCYRISYLLNCSDLSPHSHLGRVFTILYALSGVACLGIALGVLGNSVIEAQNQAAEKTKELTEKRVISLFSSDDDNEDSENGSAVDADDVAQNQSNTVKKQKQEKVEEKVHQHPILLRLAKEFTFVFIILIIFACLMAADAGVGDTDHWDFVNAMYYAIITAATVGYGDFAPQSQRGRLIAVIYIPLAVGAMGHLLGMLASVIMDAKLDSFRRELQSKELTYHDLEIMDADGSGDVTQSEFIEFMLVAMNKVDKEFIEELRAHFNRIDTDGTGYLCKGDLVHNARKKLKTAEKKMELKAYKEKLLAQSAKAKRQSERGIVQFLSTRLNQGVKMHNRMDERLM
jgi:potassium channel subfamily K, other eukaryote